MITKRELKRQVAALEERCELLEGQYNDLFRMVLFLAKEARVLDPGLCERSMESLGSRLIRKQDIYSFAMNYIHFNLYIRKIYND